MKTRFNALSVLLFLTLVPSLCGAQCSNSTSVCSQGAPHFVKFSGQLKSVEGVSQNGLVAIRFVMYSDSNGGTPLWQETQNARLDQQGHYEVMLGSTASEGIPLDLFTSGEPRWLEVQVLLPGEEPQPRVLLVSVPYAL
jgi:trimeric autotransporter adhesin